MKYKWIKKIVDHLPEERKQQRREDIKGYFSGTRVQLDQKVEESFYRQIWKACMVTLVFLILLAATILSYALRDRKIVISREETGGEVKEEQLYIKTQKEKKTYSLKVRPKGYKKEELEDAFQKALSYLDKNLKGKNKSVSEVTKKLYMKDSIPKENIKVQWKSDDLTVVDEEGNVFVQNVKEPVIVKLTAVLTCQGEEKIRIFPVCVVPAIEKRNSSQEEKIIAQMKELEEKNLTKASFIVPRKIEGGNISRKDTESSKIPVVAVLGCIVVGCLWFREESKIKEKRNHAAREAQREYPSIISKFVLYLGAGLSVQAVLEEITKDYQGKREGERVAEMFVYEQIGKAARQLEFGMSQIEVFQELGRNLNLSSYRKLTTLLVQSITKGSRDLFFRLKEEEEGAFSQRKEEAKRKGEEASTKLLAPMIIMLIVILGLLMFPALVTFS